MLVFLFFNNDFFLTFVKLFCWWWRQGPFHNLWRKQLPMTSLIGQRKRLYCNHLSVICLIALVIIFVVSWDEGEGLWEGDEGGSSWGEGMWVDGDVGVSSWGERVWLSRDVGIIWSDGEVGMGGWDEEGISCWWWPCGVVKTSLEMKVSHGLNFYCSWCITTILISERWKRLYIYWG